MSWIDEYLDDLFEPIEDFSKKLEPLYRLLETSTLDMVQRDDYEYHIDDIDNKDDYRECLQYLLDNQKNPITHGNGRYSATELNKHLKEVIDPMWNYRVIKEKRNSRHAFTIKEVYYDKNGKIEGYSEPAMLGYYDSKEDLKSDLMKMLKACDKRIITESR